MLVHHKALEVASKFTATESSRYPLDAIRLGDKIEATDARILVQIAGAYGDPAEYPCANGLGEIATAAGPALVSQKTALEAVKAAPKKSIQPISHYIAVAPTETGTTLATGPADEPKRMECIVSNSKFPNLDAEQMSAQSRKPIVTIRFGLPLLAKLVAGMKVAKASSVELRIAGSELPVSFRFHNSETLPAGAEVTGVFMPCISDD
jgi:hypothetical protein